MKLLAVEGIDGSGKTTIVESLRLSLEATGLATRTCSPFRLTNYLLGNEMNCLWSQGEAWKRPIRTFKEVVRLCEENAIGDSIDVLIFDRHRMSMVMNIDNTSVLDDSLIPTALLLCDTETARRRCQGDHDKPWMNPSELSRYSQKYEDLAKNSLTRNIHTFRTDVGHSAEEVADEIRALIEL
jgi:thymidylate kinase